MEYNDLHISSFDWCDRIATSARAHVKPKQQRGNGPDQERMIVLNPKKHLTLNRIICFSFILHFLPLFRTTFNPFIPDLRPLLFSK